MRFRQPFSGFLPVFRSLVFTGNVPLQAFEFLLCLAVVPWVRDRVALTIGIVGLEAYVDTNLFEAWDMLYLTCGLYPKLAIVAISTMNNPNTFDLFGGEGFNVLFLVAYQSQATNATAITEADMLAIRF